MFHILHMVEGDEFVTLLPDGEPRFWRIIHGEPTEIPPTSLTEVSS